MLDVIVYTLGDFVRSVGYILAIVLAIGVSAHGLTWLLFRRRATRLVWTHWNLLGAGLVGVGTATVGYAWLALGFHSDAGSVVAGLGLLLVTAGLWMLVPV